MADEREGLKADVQDLLSRIPDRLDLAEVAVAHRRDAVRYREALDEVGPLMEQAMANLLWGSLQGDWKDRALAWHKKHNATLREVQARAALGDEQKVDE